MTSDSTRIGNPYVGPRPFRRGEQLLGRNLDIIRLRDMLIAERIVLLYSPSGAGKTSLIQAALMPVLANDEFRVLPAMRVGSEIPAAQSIPPTARLAEDDLLRSLLQQETAPITSSIPGQANRYIHSALLSLEEGLGAGRSPLDLAGLSLPGYLRQRLTSRDAAQGIVLIFDQFEEIITVDPTNLAARIAFFNQIGAVLRDRRFWALFSMREEFVPSLDPFRRPIPTRFSATYRLSMLGPAAARSAILGPPRRAGVTFSEQAATRLVNDLRRVRIQSTDGTSMDQLGDVVEPVQLQVVCYRLWERLFGANDPQPGAQINEDAIDEVGDVTMALAGYYAEQMRSIAERTGIAERTIRTWIERELITPQGLRGQVLQAPNMSRGLDNWAIQLLRDAHLVRAEGRAGATWFELTHDRLVEPIRTDNATWRTAHLSMLQRQAITWQESGRPDDLLLREQAFAEAEMWLRSTSAELTDDERAFFQRSRQAVAAQKQVQRTNLLIRWLAVFLLILLVVVGGLAVAAIQSRAAEVAAANRARIAASTAQAASTAATERRDAAERSELRSRQSQGQLLAAQANKVLQDDPELGLQLALEATLRSYSPPTDTSIRTSNIQDQASVDVPPAVEQALRDAIAYSSVETSTTTLADPAGCCLTKFDATFNSDSGQLLTIDTSGALHAWDVPTQTLVLQNKPPDALQFARLTAATLTSNGERAAAADSDGNVWLWDTRRGLVVGQRPAFGTSTSTTPVTVSSIALSADGQRIAAGSDDGRVDVWEAEDNNTLIMARQIHTGKVHSIAWNPGGTQLISVDDLGMAVLWNIDTGMPETLADSTIVRAAFSPDSSQIVTAENDGRIRLWDASTGRQLRRMEPFREIPSVGIAWNKDGRRIVGLWQNGTLAVFDASTGVVISQQSIRPSTLLEANQSWTLMFSPDSRRILGIANDTKTINMWDIGLPRLHNRGGSVNGVSWSPDNRHIVIANEDGTAKIWDVATGLLERTLEGHQGAVTSTKWSPDGNLIATTGMDGTIRIWKATTGDLERTIEGHDGTVTSAAWSPDSTLILTGSADKTARVWNMIGIQVLSLDKHTGAVTGVAWSPDENTLATVGEDRLVLLWNASNGELLPPTSKALDASLREAFSSPSDGALRVTFSADSQRLAIASGGSAAFIWNITADSVLRLDAGNTLSAGQNVSAAVFSPDGSHVLTAHWDGIPRLWRPPNSASADANATQPVLLSAHIGIVTDVSFSPDGQWIVTCGEDGVAQVQYGNFRRVLAVAQQRQTRKLTIEERIQYLGGDQQ